MDSGRLGRRPVGERATSDEIGKDRGQVRPFDEEFDIGHQSCSSTPISVSVPSGIPARRLFA